MRVLLDTHVAIWAVSEPARLPDRAAKLLLDPSHELFVSIASIWEIAIKNGLPHRGGDIGLLPVGEVAAAFVDAGFAMLPIIVEHILEVEQLPPVHRDPFDRLLVAQARSEPMRLLTSDRTLAEYGEPVLLV